mgnify:CR=1 FL=1
MIISLLYGKFFWKGCETSLHVFGLLVCSSQLNWANIPCNSLDIYQNSLRFPEMTWIALSAVPESGILVLSWEIRSFIVHTQHDERDDHLEPSSFFCSLHWINDMSCEEPVKTMSKLWFDDLALILIYFLWMQRMHM